MDRDKALDMAVGQIEKQFGTGAVMRLGDRANEKVASIPTGAISLDLALGVGGIPRGRVTEIYGPESSGKTTVALHVVAEAQRAGGIAAFIDAEHALDPSYAKALGVDTEELLVSQPDTGEQALEIADMLVRSGAVDVIVVDSVAALTPRAEIEGEMGDSHVGLQARLMSQALRKLASTLNRSRTSAVFINQLREKVGVMFGCFNYATRVTLADGTQEKIGKIVNQRLPVEVLSYDAERDEVMPKTVTNWFDNGPTDGFLRFTVDKPSGNGRAQFACTPNHLIRTPSGWREASELREGDRVLQTVTTHLSDEQWDVVLGSLMGDGALSSTRSGHGARLRLGHGARQVEYAEWKASLFANLNVSRSTNDRGAVFFDMQPLPELSELREAVYVGGKKVLSDDYLKQLTPRSLAIWYMDGGGFTLRTEGKQARTSGGSGRTEICVEAMQEHSRERLVKHLRDSWDLQAKLIERGGKAIVQFPAAETRKLHELIASHVHPSMQHKLLPDCRGRFTDSITLGESEERLMPMPIRSVRWAPPNGRATHRYDLEVDGTHNYFVDGVMVHNSPETTPGGRALKFYSSVRLDVRRIESLKDGNEAVGNRVRVKVVKNKCLAAGARIFDASSGQTFPIEDVVENRKRIHVWATDKRGQLHQRPVTDWFDQGEQEVIGLRVRDGSTVRVTPDHLVMTDRGWMRADEIRIGDWLARPRRVGEFGSTEPITADQARLLGYLIGDGYVGGKTPVAFINVQDSLKNDAEALAATMGCRTRRNKGGDYLSFSHRKGCKNEVLDLVRWAGIWGHLAPEKKIPSALMADGVAEEVCANLLFGLWETDGWISREQTGGIRCGYTTTSEQLAWQVHWLLLRWGVGSSVRGYKPGSRRSVIDGRRIEGRLPTWEVRISGLDNIERFAEALPLWGPRGQRFCQELASVDGSMHRGSSRAYLPASQTEPVLQYLTDLGVTAEIAAQIIGDGAGNPKGGLKQVLGASRLRRDRLKAIQEAVDSAFLNEILEEDLFYDRVWDISDPEWARTYDVQVEELHNLVADDVVVHNCAPPFRQAEFDIMYGHGISKEGALLDLGVDEGVVKKAGAWYTYDGEQLGQGRENAKKFLAEHTDVADTITKQLHEKLGLTQTDVTGAEATTDEGAAADETEPNAKVK